jgi:DNA mismatch repair ATPase MutS
MEAVVAGRGDYNLKPYFYQPLRIVAEIDYRQDVFRELENGPVGDLVRAFAETLGTVSKQLQFAEGCFHKAEKHRWFLDAITLYCDVVSNFVVEVSGLSLESEGVNGILRVIAAYVDSEEFKRLQGEVQELQSRLRTLRYCLHIDGNRIAATRHCPGPDYGARIAAEFQTFNQYGTNEIRFATGSDTHLNHIEHAILDMLTDLYPEVFSAIENFYERHVHKAIHPNIRLFEMEVQFAVALLRYLKGMRDAGLPFCYPAISDCDKSICGEDTFDLALANILLRQKSTIVTNSLHLNDLERVIVISGPNQGGKTTFARTIGQLHYLARLGWPVPGRQAKLFLCDEIFTVFEKEEDLRTQTGKLEEELLRIRDVLKTATSKSLLIMNESFASTAPSDALLLGQKIMEEIAALDMLCVSVTFIDELASFGRTTVSMVATVNPTDVSQRTFQLVRRPADGHAYAMAIAEKHRLTRELVGERIAANSMGN